MKMANHVASMDIRSVNWFICLLYFTSSWVHGTSDLGYHAGPVTHCQPKRSEVIFPVVTDAAQNTTTNILSQATPAGLLHVAIRWRRQSLTVVLYKDEISSPATVTESTDDDDVTITTVEAVEESCSYQGRVRGQDSSTVALTTCDGLSGYIQTNHELLFIQPKNDGQNNAHLIYTCESRAHFVDTPVSAGSAQARRRRSTKPTKYLEVQVVVDHTVVKTAGSKSKATTYVLTLMNIANTAYQHNSLDQNIQVAVVKIVFLNQNQQREVFRLRQPAETINLFCKWSVRNRGGQTYDLSMLLTEDDFGHSGYAPVGVMCRQDQNCFAVRDEGFTSGFVIAHEMGHAFGLNHDGQDNSCSGKKYHRTIMSPVVVSTFNHFWWSECSKRSMATIMRSLHCLDNTPKSVDNHYRLTASQEVEEDLGIAWSLDYQCRKDFGQDYEFCKAMRGDPCNELVCNKKDSPRGCFTRHGIPLPGTNCGENKKCFNATCVEDGGKETGPAVDGTWSEWTSWTACSAECGVGIKRRSRSCQFPANVRRGNECQGDANGWSTCANYTCTKYTDKRAEECSKWEKTQGTTKWLPSESNNASLKCQQTCKALPSGSIYFMQQNVGDGTPCSYLQESSDICMDGNCIKVGCDGELNSSKRTDLCGTCGGNGSLCKTIKADYVKNSPSVRRYLKVLRIPAGARHISVKKISDAYSFLALKDGRRGTYFLNGNRKYLQFAQPVHNGAMFLYTHGNSTHLEMIITPGPIASPVDVMIYVASRINIEITYNFTVGKDDDTFEKSKFKWKFETWSECSVTCGSGTKKTVYGCYDKDSYGKVDDELCSVLKAPRIDTSRCSNPRCPTTSYSYRWKATDSWTDCNAGCDETGTQTRIYQCQKMNGNRLVSDVEANLCDNVQKDGETKECIGPLCPYSWEVGVWSECSVTCGTGSQHRDVFCGDSETDEDDARCTEDPPSESKSCDMPRCNDSSDTGCSDVYIFCDFFSFLEEKCQHDAFKRKCCSTCKRYE